jgi:uncharacterized membrane protein
MTAYRARLDTTTHWAVATTAGLVSFVLGAPGAPHYVLGLVLLLDAGFLLLEARRYRSFEMIRERVRRLERGFLLPALGAEPEPAWEPTLAEQLARPELPISLFRAVCGRVVRTYWALFAFVYLAWVIKAFSPLHAGQAGASAWGLPLAVLFGVACGALLLAAVLAARSDDGEEG